VGAEPLTALNDHQQLHGSLPTGRSGGQLISLVERSGLRGRGGAAFPVGRKLAAVASRPGAKFVAINGVEGEPASNKDRALLRQAPHLVLDGAAVAASAVGATKVYVAFSELDQSSGESLATAVDERDGLRDELEPQFVLIEAPERFIGGQDTALVNLLSGGPGLPTFGARPHERGVSGRPTLVQNAETLAHLALIARHGAEWFRKLGTDEDPGSALITLSGSVEAAGVYEIEHGQPLASVLDQARATEPLRAVLIGGYFGSWVRSTAARTARLAPGTLREHGASLGAGVIVALGESACPVAEVARVARWFSEQSAGQCGPCVNGLGAIAAAFGAVATGAAASADLGRLERWTRELVGRGACRHPDGAARFMRSAFDVFGEEIEDHARHGSCERCDQAPLLPLPAPALVA
jgi:NADH:ubiquinone oxidoreductase subunit F (NADH-binding)